MNTGEIDLSLVLVDSFLSCGSISRKPIPASYKFDSVFSIFFIFSHFFLWFYIADFHLCDGSRQTFLFWLMFR